MCSSAMGVWGVETQRGFESRRFRQDGLKINDLQSFLIFVPLKVPQRAKAANLGLRPFFHLSYLMIRSGACSYFDFVGSEMKQLRSRMLA